MKTQSTTRLSLVALACATLLGLAACGKTSPDQTAGEKVDDAVTTMEQKADTVGEQVKESVEAAKDSATEAMDSTAEKARDAAITTQINADLAGDPELSALKIDVDTVSGNVVLKGTAPNDTARERATTMAKAVSGVTSVDNQLQVGG